MASESDPLQSYIIGVFRFLRIFTVTNNCLSNDIIYTDQDLFRLIAEGREHAFSLCFYRFSPKLLAYIQSIVHSDLWAEDLLQDIFIRLWKSRQNLAAVERPEGYLMRMAANVSFSFLKHHSLEVKTQYVVARQSEMFDQNAGPENLDNQLYEQLFGQALELLSSRQKKIYQLRHNQRLSYQEIAEQMGLSLNTVRNHLVAAKKTIHGYLKKYIYDILVILCILRFQ